MDKFKKFVKKESFYVILFVCLCIVAGVATYTAKRNSKAVVPPITDNSASVSKAEKSPTIEYDDAELVKDDKQDQDKQKTDKKEGTKDSKGKAVPTSSNKKDFVTPVKEGKVTRNYNIAPRLDEEGKTAGVYKGIDIEAALGTDVMAIADGKVLEAKQGDSKEGFYVKIEHTNGMIAFYGNLDPQVKVKEGDKVTQGMVLGKTGNTIKTSPKDRKSSEYLLFHMEKSKEPVDPQKYVKDLKVK